MVMHLSKQTISQLLFESPLFSQRTERTRKLFFWPLMAMLWGFDVEAVARRSLIGGWIRECRSVPECYVEFYKEGRSALGEKVRPIENLPRHEEMRNNP